ncbi:MAG: 5-oxoprolinase subunit PxpB [Chitinophagaceae bacterium]
MTEYKIFPIGDSASTIDFGNYILESLNKKVMAMQRWLQQNPFQGLEDIVIAYSSLSVIYDATTIKTFYKPESTVFDFVKQKLTEAYEKSSIVERDTIIKRIPVCYDSSVALDINFVSQEKQLPVEEVIKLHTSVIYRVYMIGFQPGFPYMASIDERITIPRKEKMRAFVPSGSVGLAGSQTGIYPVDSPGGWQIIGRTPIKLFNKYKANALIIKPGDKVQFYEINLKEFARQSKP